MNRQRALVAALERVLGPAPLPPCALCGWPEKHTCSAACIEEGLELPPCEGCGIPLAPDGSPVGAPDPDGKHRLLLFVFPRDYETAFVEDEDGFLRHPDSKLKDHLQVWISKGPSARGRAPQEYRLEEYLDDPPRPA